MDKFQNFKTTAINVITAIKDYLEAKREKELAIQKEYQIQAKRLEVENFQIALQVELVNIFKNCHMHRLITITNINDLLPLLGYSNFFNENWHFYFTWSKAMPGEPIDNFILENLTDKMNFIIKSYIKRNMIISQIKNNQQTTLNRHPTFYYGFQVLSITDHIDSVILEVIMGFPQ